jgi:hypothetical protein
VITTEIETETNLIGEDNDLAVIIQDILIVLLDTKAIFNDNILIPYVKWH